MMVVITVSNCPDKLRGDLTRWLFEIDVNVYVGNLSARVRDEVWERICENIKSGKAAMAYSTNNEQKLDFRIHNTDWEPIDFDGIKLVRRNIRFQERKNNKTMSKAEINHINHINRMKQRNMKRKYDKYVVIDIETTGIKEEDSIIEIAAIRIKDGEMTEKYNKLIRCDKKIPEEIVKLTGITADIINVDGIELSKAIKEFRTFCADDELIGHNINFDMRFIQKACIESGLTMMKNHLTDTMRIARKKIDVDSYTLLSVAKYFGIEVKNCHRALDDCEMTYGIFEKLNET